MRATVCVLAALCLAAAGCAGEVRQRAEVYKVAGGMELQMHIFRPPAHDAADGCAAIVIVHGGGWGAGEPRLFFPHGRYFASRGMMAFVPRYRLVNKKDKGAIWNCVADSKSAVRLVRANASRLGVDPGRIAVAGDSAGGHLAAVVGVIEGLDEPGEDLAISSAANAMILLNPVLDTTKEGWKEGGRQSAYVAVERLKLAERVTDVSPQHHVRPGLPPTLLMHGTADVIVPYQQSQRFAEAMRKAGNECRFNLLEGAKHAFIVPGYSPEETVVETMKTIDRWLAEHGYLAGPPTITGMVKDPDPQKDE